MEKEKNNQNKKEEKCPLCNISEETLKRLKEGGRDQKTEDKSDKNNEG